MFDYISGNAILSFCLFLAMCLQLYVNANNRELPKVLMCFILFAALANLGTFTSIQLNTVERLYATEQQHVHSSAH